MPTPLGHGLAGLTVHVLTATDAAELRSPRRIAVVVGAAVAADLDLLFRFVDGRNHHQAESHSLGAACLAALVVVVAARMLGVARAVRLGAVAAVAWLSHILLDFLNLDTNPPIGVMALWPLSRGYFKFPVPLFLDIGRTLDWATVRHDALAAAWEAAVLLPALALAWRRRVRDSERTRVS